jgi:hypothetical protein
MENNLNLPTTNWSGKQEIKINIPEGVEAPEYSNMMQIHSSKEEVLLSFEYIQPNSFEGTVVSRVVVSHDFLKEIYSTIAKQLDHYSEDHCPLCKADQPLDK